MPKTFGLFLMCVCLLTVLITINKATAQQFGLTTNLCEKLLTDKNLISLITETKDAATPCACAEYDMAQDVMFEKVGTCFEELLFNDGAKHRCCYSENGKLLTGYRDIRFGIPGGIVYSMNEIHDSCCNNNNQSRCNAFYEIIQSDNCQRHQDQHSAFSWGDPVIETVSNTSYSLNGHGEYVFLKSNNTLEIQARTDYLIANSNDSTIFTAFVFTIYPLKQSIHVIFNRTSMNLNLYDNNGNLSTSTSSVCNPRQPIMGDAFMVFCSNTTSALGFQITPKVQLSNIKALVTLDNEFMNIKITYSKELANMTGLAGNVQGEFYVSPNGTNYSVNSNESLMFEYGETWSLRNNPNSSNFWYNLTGGDFSSFNKKSTPRFLENLLDNPDELFKNCNNSTISDFKNACRNSWDNQTNKECMLTIARTCNTTLGKAIQNQVETQRYELQRKSNNAPTFLTTMPNETRLIYKGNATWSLNLSSYVSDENITGLRFQVEPLMDGMTLNGSIFNWLVGTSLRNSKNRTIRFIVTDQFTMTDDQEVRLYYCGCEDPSQCKFERKDDDDPEFTAECNCTSQYVSGVFCEIKTDPCSIYKCYQQELCDNRTVDGSPCVKCPNGTFDPIYGSKTQECRDINECNDIKTHGCQHFCHDLNGSYECSCQIGYTLNADSHTCSDDDECASGKVRCPKSKETCMNLPGNYTCVCQAGYSKETPSAECNPIVGTMYFGYIAYVLTSPPTQTNVTLQAGIHSISTNLSQILNGTDYFLAIEIYQIFVTSAHFHMDFIVHMNSTLGEREAASKIEKQLQKTDMWLASTNLGQSVVVQIHFPNEGGLCNVEPKRTECNEQSTYCVNKNSTDDYYDCACRFGYKKPISAKRRVISCDDVNECEEYDGNGTTNERCVYGTCSNTVGSWNCTCPPDRLWMSVGTPANPLYRCQGNHSYLGNVSFIWEAQREWINQTAIKSFLTSQITEVFSNVKLDQENSPPVASLFVSVTILENTSYSGIPDTDLHKFTYEFRIRMGDPVSTDLLQKIGSERFKQGVKIGTVAFKQFIVFNESDNELCRRSNQGHCERRSTECKQENGTTTCVCKEGFQQSTYLKYSCEDVDECTLNKYTCSGGGTCQNADGNWTCLCPPYTKLLNDKNTRRDCSEEAYYNCSSEAYTRFNCPNGNKTCNNSVWSCDCAHGYQLKGSKHASTCTDINECGSGNPCGNGNCSNSDGGYTCKCERGFQLNETETSCIDIDECHSEKYICENGDCTNFNGSYTCNCKTGFREVYRFGNTTTICVDIDECTNKSYSCGTNGTCTNSKGSFICDCPHGYKSYNVDNTSYNCADINECNQTADYKCVNGSCKNTEGRWDCVCDVSKRKHVVNESYIECRDVFQYPVQFEIQILHDPHNAAEYEENIQPSLIKMLSDIVNGSMNGSVLFPVEVPERYHYLDHSNILVTVNVIIVKRYDAGLLKNTFEASFNKTAVLTTPSGISGVVSLKKEETPVNLCTLERFKNKCDLNSTKCKHNKDTVQCDCLGGFTNLTDIEGVGMCLQIKDPKGDYPYFVSVNITINNSSNISSYEFEKAVQQQFTAIYSAMFPGPEIWVEILAINGTQTTSRRQRRSGDTKISKISVEHVLHKTTPVNKTTLAESWNNSRSIIDKLKNETTNTTSYFEFEPMADVSDNRSPCIITKMCDANSTTCNDTSGEAVCDCKPGFVNNTYVNETNVLNPYYECYRAYEELINMTTQTISAFTTNGTHSTTSGLSMTNYSPSPRTPSVIDSTTNQATNTTRVEQGLKTPHELTIADQTPTSVAGKTTLTTTKTKDGVDVKNEDKSTASSNTALIATGASLGSVVLILAVAVIVVCRLRSKKAQDTERIKLRKLEKERRNGFDNSLLGRNYLRSDSKQNFMNDLRETDRETDRDDRRNSYNGGPFKPIEPTYTRPVKPAEPEPIWDRNGHVPGLKGRTGSLPDINDHVDMRMAPEARRMSQPRNSDPLYTSPRKDKDPPPTQKHVDNYRQNMVRVFPESGQRLPRAKTNQSPRKNASGRISPEPDYYDDPPLSPKPDYNGRKSRDRVDASRDSGLNGFSRSSGSPEVQRSRESFGYGSLGRGRYRMEDTPF